MILCCIARDLVGFLLILALGPLVYGYILFKSAGAYDPVLYLRVPFPFLVALFYGYFAQVQQAQNTLHEELQKHQQIQRHRERQSALYDINLAITSSLNLQKVLGRLLEKVESQLPYSTATAITLSNRATGDLQTVACRGLGREKGESGDWKGGESLDRSAIRCNSHLYIRDIQLDPRVEDREIAAGYGLFSYLGVPLVAKNQKLGVLAIFTKGRQHDFSQEELEFVTTLAGQAAIAIHNSQLYEELKKQTEELEKLNAQLEKANRVKSEFLGVMSHELRTPLNVVIGYIGMIRDRLLGEINLEQQDSLGKVLKQSRILLAMISSILDATKLEADAVKAESQVVVLGDLLNDLRWAYDIPLDRDVAIIWDYPQEMPVVRIDGDKVKRILRNLIDNSIKFTLRGSVTISALHFPRARTIELRVSDTGLGMSHEALPVIFDMFQQLDGSGNRSYGGVGLGLYIVKKLTDVLGGEIQVNSEPGKGTSFTVRIPYEYAEQRELAPCLLMPA